MEIKLEYVAINELPPNAQNPFVNRIEIVVDVLNIEPDFNSIDKNINEIIVRFNPIIFTKAYFTSTRFVKKEKENERAK